MNFYTRNKMLYIRIDGKRISSKLLDTPNNRKLIESYHKNDDFLTKFNLIKKVPTLIFLCLDVLELKEKYLKSTSYSTYEALFNTRIKPFFKDKKVNEITRSDILRFYNTFNDKSTLNICSTLLKASFEKAIIEDYIKFIPLVKKPTLISSYEINPFSLIEIDKLINSCTYLTLKNVLGLGFYSGMRIGEIIALKWVDVDFNSYTIDINKTVTSGFEQSPKTKSSLRIIDMLPQAEQFLISQRRVTGLKKYVFLSPRGNRFNRSVDFFLKWKKLQEDCNIVFRNIYQIRHSFASNMLNNQESLNWVSFMLGHKSPNITLQKYSRYIKIKRVERKKTFLDENTYLAHSS